MVYYDPTKILFIDLDASKRYGFAGMIYHIKDDNLNGKDTDIEPIMFLSRGSNDAERNYWPTELEIAGIAWIVKKIRYMIEANQRPPVILQPLQYSSKQQLIPLARTS